MKMLNIAASTGLIALLAAGCNQQPTEQLNDSTPAAMDSIQNSTSDKNIPTGNIAIQDPMSKKAQLKDVTMGTGTGMAYVLRKDGMLYHSVTATIPDPPQGEFYEGWLVKNPATKEFFSTGKMTKNSNGAYELSFDSQMVYEGYDTVVITLEKIFDKMPEAHILEGTVQ